MSHTRRKFDSEFRAGAVRIVRETRKPVVEIARDLGVAPSTFYKWRDRPPTPARRRRAELDVDIYVLA